MAHFRQQIRERVATTLTGLTTTGSNNFDDTIDTICKEVEEALYADRLINNLAKDSFLTNTEINFNSDGDNPVGIVVMTFEIAYHHTEGTLE
jgi:hypothetical protein